MMYRIALAFLLALAAGAGASAQPGLEALLAQVAQRNPAFLAHQQYLEAQKLSFRTGLAPANPLVEFDYLKGRPEGAGNQRDFAVTQSFDFPTAYRKKRQLAEERTAQTVFQATAFRQNILLEAKLYYLELVYLNQQHQLLAGRLQNLERLAQDYQQKVTKGDASVLELNKVKIQLVGLRQELRENENDRVQFTQRLSELTGGMAPAVTETDYPPFPPVPPYAVLDSLVEAQDPDLKGIRQEKEISQREKEVTRALTLPKLQAGYHYQAILGQVYEGVHAGLTLPLWQDRHRVREAEARIVHDELQIQRHLIEHQHKIRQLYLLYENLQNTLADYRQLRSTLSSAELLAKALRLGQISSVEYLTELTFLYAADDKYLLAEKEYHQVLAELFKFSL